MTIQELYEESIKDNHYSLWLLINFLMFEKRVIKPTDDASVLDYYLQERFKNKMNTYLLEYERKLNSERIK
ncbi:hypothetical protein A7K69_02185 [Parageobacillus thermoglucosidasius]|uniref:Uncharacterized protein n=1 Tax=Parageobacillus thermoglucosidasius TaxID=1426 RepID=A0A1B7KWM9_PARTM|nr:hypothetical protein A7K69_02185 [Parageobacillus thermoglucosidasius]